MRSHRFILPEIIHPFVFSLGLCLILGFTSAFIGCGGSGGGSGDNGVSPSLPVPDGGSYAGEGVQNDSAWFLISTDGKQLMNFGLYKPSNGSLDPEVAVDLTAPLNTAVKELATEGGRYIFDFAVYNPNTNLLTKVKAYHDGTAKQFECLYSGSQGTQTFSGSILCSLYLAEDDLGQSLPEYTFRDIALNTGAINVLGKGTTMSFGNFSVSDNIDDLWMPCSPSLYHFTLGAENGLGYCLVDETYGDPGQSKYGTPTESELFSLWADLDVNGKPDLISGSGVYLNKSGLAILFEKDSGFEITQSIDPGCCDAVDYNGDSDLDLFTGYWYTNRISDYPGSGPVLEEEGATGGKVEYTLYPDTIACAFAPIDFDADAPFPDVDLDMAQIVIDGGDVKVKVFRCDRNLLGPSEPSAFVEVAVPELDNLPDAESLVFADVNNDLKPDLFVAGTTKESARLLRNDTNLLTGEIVFTDVTDTAFAGQNPPVSGDAVFFDYDNDGRVDLLVAAPSGEAAHRLYRNETDAIPNPFKFTETTFPTNIDKITQKSGTHSRCTWCDIDGNGALEPVLGLTRLWIMENSGGIHNHLKVLPLTKDTWGMGTLLRAAPGAIVLVDLEGDGSFQTATAVMRVIPAGRQTHLVEHFGLGDLLSSYGSTTVDVRVYFPDGNKVEANNPIDVLQHQGSMNSWNPLKIYHD